MRILLISILTCILVSCSSERVMMQPGNSPQLSGTEYKYLALGDSYTIGESVCGACSFPAQLQTRLDEQLEGNISLRIIARTGWTTTELLQAIEREDPEGGNDLVTLLIGVNNQFRGLPFSTYEKEFKTLLNKAIALAKDDVNRVVVISIPDYAYTPFGQRSSNPPQISREIDIYNAYAKDEAEALGVQYLEITDITRQGLTRPELVANDGLHPSSTAYTEFVDRLLPVALNILR